MKLEVKIYARTNHSGHGTNWFAEVFCIDGSPLPVTGILWDGPFGQKYGSDENQYKPLHAACPGLPRRTIKANSLAQLGTALAESLTNIEREFDQLVTRWNKESPRLYRHLNEIRKLRAGQV